MTALKFFQKASWIIIGTIAVFVLLFWSLMPLMQHAIDRTSGFWLFWSAIEIALIAIAVVSFARKSEKKHEA